MPSVRYLVNDVDQAVAFYTKRLGFALKEEWGPVAVLSMEGLELWVSGPSSSAGRTRVDGRNPAPGGSNRLVVQVKDLQAKRRALEDAAVRVISELVRGPAGSWILVADPDGNPIELFEPK